MTPRTPPKPTRLLWPWNFPGKNTGVDCHSLLQRNFPTQGSNPGLLHHRQDSLLFELQGSRPFGSKHINRGYCVPGTCHHSLYLTTPRSRCHYPHFPDVETEAHKVQLTYLRSCGWLASELEFHTGRLTPGPTPSDSFPEVASALRQGHFPGLWLPILFLAGRWL